MKSAVLAGHWPLERRAERQDPGDRPGAGPPAVLDHRDVLNGGSLSSLVAGVVAGQLWNAVSPAAAFLYGTATAVLGAALF